MELYNPVTPALQQRSRRVTFDNQASNTRGLRNAAPLNINNNNSNTPAIFGKSASKQASSSSAQQQPRRILGDISNARLLQAPSTNQQQQTTAKKSAKKPISSLDDGNVEPCLRRAASTTGDGFKLVQVESAVEYFLHGGGAAAAEKRAQHSNNAVKEEEFNFDEFMTPTSTASW